MPEGPGEGEVDTTDYSLIQARPQNPFYVAGDELTTPDAIINVDAPQGGAYRKDIAAGSAYVAGVKLQYKCWKTNRSKTVNCWKIELSIIAPVSTDGFLQNTILKVYPFACSGYNFNYEDVRSYIYGIRY